MLSGFGKNVRVRKILVQSFRPNTLLGRDISKSAVERGKCADDGGKNKQPEQSVKKCGSENAGIESVLRKLAKLAAAALCGKSMNASIASTSATTKPLETLQEQTQPGAQKQSQPCKQNQDTKPEAQVCVQKEDPCEKHSVKGAATGSDDNRDEKECEHNASTLDCEHHAEQQKLSKNELDDATSGNEDKDQKLDKIPIEIAVRDCKMCAFEVPAFLPCEAFRKLSEPTEQLGPCAGKDANYKNPEYYAYHRYSFTDILQSRLKAQEEKEKLLKVKEESKNEVSEKAAEAKDEKEAEKCDDEDTKKETEPEPECKEKNEDKKDTPDSSVTEFRKVSREPLVWWPTTQTAVVSFMYNLLLFIILK